MDTRILIIDDEPNVAQTLARLVGRKGYHTTAVNSYDSAVAKLGHSGFDLALIDYVMPGKNGVDLSRYIRGAYPEMGTIIMSAMPDKALFRDSFGAADRFIEKTQTLTPLFDAIGRVLTEKAAEVKRLRMHYDPSCNTTPQCPRIDRCGSQKTLPTGINVGALTLDFAHQRFALGSTSMDLTPREVCVLSHLAAHANELVGRDPLERLLQESQDDTTAASKLNRTIHSIRTRLKAISDSEAEVRTVRGGGYILDIVE